MKKILITGSNGLIGSELMNVLSQNTEYEITGVGRHSSDQHKTLNVDFSKNWSIDQLPEKCDVIIHLAQSEKFRDFPESSQEVFDVNTTSTLKLLEYARKCGAQKFIYASSGGIYGNKEKGFDEDQAVIPNKDLGFYLGTKLCSEIAVESFSNIFDTIILRFFFAYGKKQNKSMLIPRLVDNIKNGNAITLQGQNGITINPIHVSDAATAVAKSIELKGNHKINVAGSEELSLKQICEAIGEKVNKKVSYNFQQTEPKNLIGDIKKMESILVKPKINFKKGLDDMI